MNLWTKRCFEPCFIRDKQQRWCYVIKWWALQRKSCECMRPSLSFSVSLSWMWLNCDPHQQYWQRHCPAEPIPINRRLQPFKCRQLAGNYMLVSVVRWFPFEGWECCMIIRWVLQNVSVKRALYFYMQTEFWPARDVANIALTRYIYIYT